MKKICMLTLVLVLLLLPVLSFTSCEKKNETYTFVGTVTYSERSGLYTFIHARPLGIEENSAPWIRFEVDSETEMDSYYLADDIASVPEYQIGTTIEIVYKITIDPATKKPERSYTAVSLKVIDPSTADVSKQDFSLKADESYAVDDGTEEKWIWEYSPKIVHIVKLESPRAGYLLYLIKSRAEDIGLLACYWIDENTSVDEGLLEELEAGNTDIDINITTFSGEHSYPFEELDINYVYSISYAK